MAALPPRLRCPGLAFTPSATSLPTAMKLTSLSLTTKIVLLVASMGLACAMAAVYATWHMQRMEQHYHQLLDKQAAVAVTAANLRQQLADTSALVHGVLTFDDEDHVLLEKERLTLIQQDFEANIQEIHGLLPEQMLHLDMVFTQARHVFAAGHRVINGNLRWRSDRALLVLAQSFTPGLEKLHTEVEILKRETQELFQQTSQHLASQTHATITKTNWAGGLSVLLISALAAWVAWRFISRPIARLTRSMQRMSQHHYDTPVADQARNDEIGSMARTLQRFGTSLQEAEQLEHELMQQQKNNYLNEQLQQLTSALPGAVFQMQLSPGASVKLRFVSPQWAQLMGMEPGADTSVENAAKIIRHHDINVLRIAEKNYQESAHTLQPVDFEVAMQMRDGVTRWIKTRANPLPQADGSTIFNGVWLDVTKEVMQARALEKAKRQAEQSAAEKSTLQASISHEIRTPLNAILGLTQLLLKSDLQPGQREQLNNVLRAGQHLRGIVNEVLDFSKIDAGQLKLESTDFSLENVVLDVLSMCHEDASNKGLSLNYKMAREVPDSLRGDPHRIAQILLNYVNNAIKFTSTGHIHIALRLDPSSTLHRIVLHASVTDTGPGIPADRIPLLFEAFQQADNSITRRFGGTGLGLTISRALAQLMGGSAGVQSTLGQGSTFWFTAVLEPARAQVSRDQAALPHTLAPAAEWQGLRILVVDDNPLNRAVVEGMLHALGLHTEMAEDGAQALDRLQAVGPTHFSCVLMDLQMPQIDGISATKALREWPGFANLPIIAMTAHTGVQDVERTQAAGMNAHLSKPLLEPALHAILHQWLGTGMPLDSEKQPPATEPEPPVFDATAVDALAQLFDTAKLQQLVAQFSQDSLHRAQQMPALALHEDWQAMRGEAHKLTGTAATFGLLRLGHAASELSGALKAQDTARTLTLAQQVAEAAQDGIAQLQTYAHTVTATA